MAKKGKSPTKLVPATKAKPTSAKAPSRSGGPTAASRILNAIASRRALGEERADRKMVMAMALMTNKRSFDTTLLNMKNKGLVEYDTPTVWLTMKGLEEVGPEAAAPPQNNEAMQAKLKETMIKVKSSYDVFDQMVDGRWYSRAELADKMGVENNRSFGTYVSGLSKVVDRDNGTRKIRLKDMAFPCGRPCDSE